jgi:hypothetical protein
MRKRLESTYAKSLLASTLKLQSISLDLAKASLRNGNVLQSDMVLKICELGTLTILAQQVNIERLLKKEHCRTAHRERAC